MNYIMFARWFGIVSVILSLGILFNLEDAKEMAKHMVKTESGYIMGGVLPVIFGTLSLMYASELTMDWNLVVTLVGFAMLMAGIYRVVFVNHWQSLLSRNIEQIPFLFSLFGLMLGVMLLYVGFIADSLNYTV
jgi:hypothetical protein